MNTLGRTFYTLQPFSASISGAIVMQLSLLVRGPTRTSFVARSSCVEPWRNRHLRSSIKSLTTSCYSRRRVTVLQDSRAFSSHAENSDDNTPSAPDFLERYKLSLQFPEATSEIKALKKDLVDLNVCLHGYLGRRVDISKRLSFVPLIDKSLSHSIQIISHGKEQDGAPKESHAKLKALNQHTPVAIQGILRARKSSKIPTEHSDDLKKKDLEVDLLSVQSLNAFPKDLQMEEDTNFISGERHLQLRTKKELRDALAFRPIVANICRNELGREEGFVEIETPLLFKSTPEGAREFLVPTREKGMAYALPQSPQQYKQILMASGIPKYFQMARCFRDEDLRADRQPEFTQLDLEMSFATGKQVMAIIEKLLTRLWSEMLHVNVPSPFNRLTYQAAMKLYGSDKPDLRLGMKLHQIETQLPADLIGKIGPLVDPKVDMMKLQVSEDPSITATFVREFMESAEAATFISNPDGQPGIFIYDPRKPLNGLQSFGFETAEYVEKKLELSEGDLVILQARKNVPHRGGFTPMGRLRLALHKAAVAKGHTPAPTGFEFLWITDFPLFTPTNEIDPGQGGSAGFSATHHPFTAPSSPEDVDLLSTSPLEVIADHYDIVVNGVELGGGSRRIHNAEMQEYILRDILQMSEERLGDFRHLLDVLKTGCPPHAGIAIGFDRLIAVMLGKDSIRDVIAFPKSAKGEDMLVRSPNRLSKAQLEEYHLKLID